jgi:hypothetical protein
MITLIMFSAVCMDRDNVVGIATRYGMEEPGGSNSHEGAKFPAPVRGGGLGPNQAPIQWVTGLYGR